MIVERQVRFAAVLSLVKDDRAIHIFLAGIFVIFFRRKDRNCNFQDVTKKYFNFRQKIFKSIITALHGYVTRIELHEVLCTPFLAKKNKSIN